MNLFVHTASACEGTRIYCDMPQRPENNAAYSPSHTLAVTATIISFCVPPHHEEGVFQPFPFSKPP